MCSYYAIIKEKRFFPLFFFFGVWNIKWFEYVTIFLFQFSVFFIHTVSLWVSVWKKIWLLFFAWVGNIWLLTARDFTHENIKKKSRMRSRGRRISTLKNYKILSLIFQILRHLISIGLRFSKYSDFVRVKRDKFHGNKTYTHRRKRSDRIAI